MRIELDVEEFEVVWNEILGLGKADALLRCEGGAPGWTV